MNGWADYGKFGMRDSAILIFDYNAISFTFLEVSMNCFHSQNKKSP